MPAMQILTLTTPQATATISLYGGQVMSFIPAGQPDILWRTTPQFLQAAQAGGKALRGGVPLCWPWFRGHPTVAKAPSHGLGRLSLWQVEEQTPNTATLSLTLDGTNEAFPHKVKGTLKVTLTDKLDVALSTTNMGDAAFPLQQALHTYLNVGNVSQVKVHGLQGATRIHITPGKVEEPLTAPLTINAEVEHLFSPVNGTIRVDDPANARTICVANRGGDEAVVWNPWVEKAKGLDMDPESYTQMLCVEAANANLGPVQGELTLAPGQTHTLATTLWSEKV